MTKAKPLDTSSSFVSEKSVLWKFTLCDCRFYRQFIVEAFVLQRAGVRQIWEVNYIFICSLRTIILFIVVHIESTDYELLNLLNWFGEFDPGSEWTLAAWLRHASRTGLFNLTLRLIIKHESGKRVRNTWATCPKVWDSSGKLELIPDVARQLMLLVLKLVMAL